MARADEHIRAIGAGAHTTLLGARLAPSAALKVDDVQLHPLTLRMPEPYEARFRQDYARRSLGQVRLALALGLLLYASFGVLDSWIEPLAMTKLWLVRYGIVCPVFALALVATFVQRARLEQVLTGVAVTAGLGIVAMIRLMPQGTSTLYYAGLMLVMMWMPFVKLRFWRAAIASWIIIAAYELVAIGHGTPLEVIVSNNFFFISSDFIALSTCYVLELYARRAFLHEQQLATAIEKSEALLLNVLPEAVAMRLKERPGTIADAFPQVSVLFADIVGFTALASSRRPQQIVEMLNELFSQFDGLAERYGVEKIKTIGDAYMAVAGLPRERPDHAEAIADFALAMREASQRCLAPDGTPLSVRIGIHSGPVVAGVIGRKKFIYDVWGDAVNLASRMESHGLADQIQISEATSRLLARTHVIAARGDISIKGKGDLPTWLLHGRATLPSGERSAG